MSLAILDDKKQLFKLIKNNAFFREKIILSSGKESDYYIDARRVTLSSEGAYLCARLMLSMIEGEKYDAIGGPTLGADPLIGAVGVLSHQAGQKLNTFIIRKAPKAHGKQQQIEGMPIPTGAKVILIDDVATTGKAFLESIEVLKRDGITAPVALCVVDRGEGAKEVLAQQNCKLLSLFTAQDFLKVT
ncbi:MAG: orotate phosphoribosyltransferase [Candidatus Omnitrophica bacterium]|nr:orotate phosphoribosyltransferase [Candidatus Omnitrophota bacterium]